MKMVAYVGRPKRAEVWVEQTERSEETSARRKKIKKYSAKPKARVRTGG